MKKILLITFIITLYSILPISSQEFSIMGEMYTGYIDFFGNELVFFDFNGGDPKESKANYNLISDNTKFQYLDIKAPVNQKYLFLKSEKFSLLLDNENRPVLYGLNPAYKKSGKSTFGLFEGFFLTHQFGKIEASSYLVEGEVEYLPQNISEISGAKPWVEGVDGNGIGEKITISDFYANHNPHTLIISIGYVDYNKPHLYEYNSRPSKIRLWFKNKEEYIDFELDDTPEPQYVNFSSITDEITIEIMDVYEGSKWNDTCINFIFIASEISEYFSDDD